MYGWYLRAVSNHERVMMALVRKLNYKISCCSKDPRVHKVWKVQNFQKLHEIWKVQVVQKFDKVWKVQELQNFNTVWKVY